MPLPVLIPKPDEPEPNDRATPDRFDKLRTGMVGIAHPYRRTPIFAMATREKLTAFTLMQPLASAR